MSTTLPVVPRQVLDTSVLQTWQRCPRKAYYQYYLNRSPSGKNWSIGFGLAYHAYREIFEKMCREEGEGHLTLLHEAAVIHALDVFGPEDPPLGHSKEFLTRQRLIESCAQGLEERAADLTQRGIRVLEVEQGFQLELPSGRLFGGRFDQIIEWHGKLWVRDFKTTSRMGKSYARSFDPNDQMTCYTWAGQQLSGRPVQGVIIQVIYNTKNQGPKHFQFLATRSPAHIEEWQRNIEKEATNMDDHLAEDYFPMRTTACNDFNGCFYRDCCGMSSWKQRDAWLQANTVESHWDFMNPDEEEGIVD